MRFKIFPHWADSNVDSTGKIANLPPQWQTSHKPCCGTKRPYFSTAKIMPYFRLDNFLVTNQALRIKPLRYSPSGKESAVGWSDA